MTIWKCMLRVDDLQIVYMPKGAKLLSVQIQNGVPCLWALVDPTEEQERRTIHMRGTGHNATLVKGLDYVSTFQMRDGALVFHVFA